MGNLVSWGTLVVSSCFSSFWLIRPLPMYSIRSYISSPRFHAREARRTECVSTATHAAGAYPGLRAIRATSWRVKTFCPRRIDPPRGKGRTARRKRNLEGNFRHLTIANFETGDRAPYARTLADIRKAFESAERDPRFLSSLDDGDHFPDIAWMMRGRQIADIVCIFLLFGNSLSENSNLCYGSSSTLSNRGTHMAVGVVISFGGAKSRAFLDDRPRTRSADRPGHPRRHKPGHAGLADAPPASLPAVQRKSRGGENFPNRKIYRK